MKYIIWFSVLIYAMSLVACKESDPPLTRAERTWIDTIYQSEVRGIKNRIDSICVIQNDSIYKGNFDSILQKRKDERALIIHQLKIDRDE